MSMLFIDNISYGILFQAVVTVNLTGKSNHICFISQLCSC